MTRGYWPTVEEARTFVGDTWPSITIQGLAMAPRDRSEVFGPSGWGIHANMQFAAGHQDTGIGGGKVLGEWLGVVYSCTLTVSP